MDWFAHTLTVSNLINVFEVFGVYAIKSELQHIRESIDNAKELAGEAKNTALKAHERIEALLQLQNK